jgi:hypothetical protein
MNDDKLKKAYQSALKYYDLPDFETFKSDMTDENNLRKFRDNLSKHYDIPDFNTFKSDMGIVKKKETTALPSVQKQKPISSGTQPKVTQKPSATSVSKKDKDREGFFTLESDNIRVYSGLPGKEKTQYRISNNKWQRRDESGWRDLDSQNSIDILNKYFDKKVKGREDITRELESNVKKAEVEKELSDKELASILGWSEEEVKKSKSGSGTPNKDFKAAMVKPDIVKPSESNAIGTMAVSTQKAYNDLGKNASTEEIQKKTKYYDIIESQKYLKSIGYDIDVNGDESDEKTKIALNKEKVKQDVITKDAFKAADKYQSIDNEISQDLLSNNEEFVVSELRKKYSKDGFYFEETGVGNSMIVKYSPIEGVETREIEIPLNTNDINNVNALKDFMKQSYMTASERKNLSSEDLDIRTQEGRNAHIDKLLNLMASNPYKYGTSLLSEDEIETHINNSYSSLKEESENLQEEYKDLQYRINKFNEDPSNPQEKAYINNKIHELSQKELQINNRYNDLSSVDKSINKIASINYDKSKEPGNWIGVLGSQFIQGITNPEKTLTQISMDVLPYAIGEDVVDPVTRQKLKDQGYSDNQILDYASKQLKNNLYENIKEGITNVSSLGTTTSEYVNSSDRNDLLKAASFLAESIGTSLSAGGNPALQKIAFFTQSYNAMEEQMMGPQFDALNEWQKKLISVPYGFVIGALERYGLAALGEGANPVVNRFATAIVNKTMLSLPKDATIDTIKREINKNVGAMIAQGALRVAGGSLVEGGTEATQQLFEIGEKFLVNKIVGSDKEPGFEYFKDVPDISTADGLKKAFEIAGTDFYYGALGGLLMSGGVNAYQTRKQNRFNKKTDKEFEAFYDSVVDDKLRKLNILNTKIKLKNGEITKEEAKETIDAINIYSQKLKSLNPNLSLRDKKDAFNLMLQRDKLEQEKAPLDEAMQAPYNERITNINNELKTISENATKESNIEEVTAEGGGLQREGAREGQPQVGEGEGAVGETTQPETDLGNRPVEGRGIQEEGVTRDVINRPSTLSEFGGNTFDTPLQGDTYVDGQQVVFEDRATGRIYELGNIDEVMDSSIPGLQAQEETVSITPEGKVSIEGNNWNIQSELPTQGIEYNPAGEVTRVSLKDDAGNTQMFEGQQAVDIAYQIELQKIQSTEQQQFINDLLEQDEEFQTATESIKPRQIEAVVQEEAVTDTVQAEPTAVAEEVTTEEAVTPEVQAEVEALGNLLEGTDQQIDEQVGGLRISKDNKKVAQSIANAAKAIAKILPSVKFVVHDTDASYRKATNEEGRSQSSSGEYNNKTKTIHINASKANNRTAAHEVFHAILLNKIGSDIELQRLTKAMIDSVLKSLPKTKGSEEVVAYLEKFASQYDDKTIFNEEKLAELFGILADNYAKLPAQTQNIIQRFIDRVRKILGLKPMTDKEVIDFMNTVSQKVAKGEEITAKDIAALPKSKQIAEANKRFQADFSDAVSKLTFVFDKNGERFKKLEKDGYITRDKSLSDFEGKYIFLHQPDAAFSGMIFKDGEVLVEGKGGVFYPIKFHEDGYFWASTDRTAKKMADDLNKVMEQNGGTIYMALTSAPSDKLMSSTTMANAILDFFSSKALDKNFKVTPTQLRTSLRKAANDVKTVNNKKVGLDLKLPATATIEEMQSAIRTALGSENSSFADRKNFAVELTKLMANEINKNDIAVSQFGKLFSDGIQNKYFKGITKTGKLKISAANMTQALSEMFTEPMLKEGIDREKGGQVYAILELNGPVKSVKSDKHESYPMAIESANKDNKVTLHLLNDRQNWSDTFEDFETGDIVSKERQLKIFPTSGVSVQGLKVNTSKVAPRKQEAKNQVDDKIDNSFEARKQTPQGITQIIATARQNGFSDAAITQYLLNQGYTQQQITNAMASVNPSGVTIDDVFKKSQEDLEAKLKSRSVKQRVIDMFRSTRRTLLNRQTDIKRALRGIKNTEAKQAYAKLVTKAGASGFAGVRFKIVAKKIYGKLKESEIEALDKIIYARRIISVNENRKAKGMNPYAGIRGYNESDAQNDLAKLRNELGNDKFDKLNSRADIYFDVFSDNLKKLRDSGRISEETYNNLKDVEYSPIKTIKYIIKDNYDPNDLDKEAARLGISKKDIMSLTDSNENGIITDSRWLLMMNLNMVESRVFENQMLNELVAAIENATAEERVALSDYFILDNPIVGQFKDGRPKRKFDDEALPDGYTRVHYFKDGIDNYIIAKEAIAKQILDVKNSKITPAIEQFNEDVPIFGWLVKQLTLTPSRLLRFFATGGNPFFILGNVPMDWANAVFFNKVYSHKWYEKLKVISGVEAAWGFVKNFTKSAISKGEWNKIYMEYAEHGGLMETMSQEGLRALQEMKPTGRLAKKLPGILSPIFKGVVGAPYKLIEGYGKAMSYLGETSEVAMRLAVYEKMKSNLIYDFKKENGVNPTGKQLDDIMWEASREARELIDFNQGGSWAKEVDVFMPYFNASMQGLRKPLDYARENPVGFSSSMIQLTLMAGTLAGYSISAGLAAFDGDDDEERKKKMRKALDSITAREKANYHIIFTGKKDKNGELVYIRVKKLPVASIVTTWAEYLVYNKMLGYDNKEAEKQALEAAVPFWPSELKSRNPLISGILTYAYNEDTFTGEKVFREPKNKKILPTAEGMFDDKVEGIYKALAPSLGLSPARSKAFVEKFITSESTNPTINIIYAAANGIFDKGTTFGDEFSSMTEELLKHSERKFIRTTNQDIIRFNLQDEFEKKEMVKETQLYLNEQKMYNKIKKIYDDGGSLDKEELKELVKNNFDKVNQKRALMKYYSYIKNMKIDRSLLDIVYEDVPEVQAMRLYERYGSVIENSEVDELRQIIKNSGQRLDPKALGIYKREYKGSIIK